MALQHVVNDLLQPNRVRALPLTADGNPGAALVRDLCAIEHRTAQRLISIKQRTSDQAQSEFQTEIRFRGNPSRRLARVRQLVSSAGAVCVGRLLAATPCFAFPRRAGPRPR